MVDVGSGQSPSVIDLTTRRRRMEGQQWSPPDGMELGGQSDDFLSVPFLVERLAAENQQVGMWAAYQLVDRWQAECEHFIDRLWESPHEEIYESAISLIGKFKLTGYAFPLMRIFNSLEHPLRPVAGVALGALAYEPVSRSLERWFLDAVADPDTPPQVLECATESVLRYDAAANWGMVFGNLEACHQNHAFYSILFGQLCHQAKSPGQIAKLAGAYGKVRDVFNDVALTQHLVDLAGRSNLIRFFQTRLGAGYPLNAIYRDCLKVTGFEPADEETRGLIDALAECRNRKEGLQKFLTLSDALLDRLAPDPDHSAAPRQLLKASQGWLEGWENAILKVRELEYHLIVSLPLTTLLNQAEAACLADPDGEALRITRIYQSSLISPSFMVEVLKLIGVGKSHSGMAEMGNAPYVGWVRDEEKDALWRLFTDQMKNVDYPLEQVLPQPWIHPVPDLMEKLVNLLQPRIGDYVAANRRQAVDYCLEIIRRAGTAEAAGVLLPHFDVLINQHYHGFVELMTHLPDVRFLQLLVNHYRHDETDLLRLIHFICDVHGRPHPELEQGPPETAEKGEALGTLRLTCRSCGGAYEYRAEAVYVDEERIEQRQIPTVKDVWTLTRFECKNCGADVPFDPDERYLNDLFTELLAIRLFPLADKEDSSVEPVRLIQFPVFQGKTLNPAHFLKEMERLLEAPHHSEQEIPPLLELGRFQMVVGDPEAAKQTFQRILGGPAKCPLALYYLGVLAFQEKNLYEARVQFSRLTQTCTREDFGEELDNPVDMAHHYLKLLDKREFKRSQFQLISS